MSDKPDENAAAPDIPPVVEETADAEPAPTVDVEALQAELEAAKDGLLRVRADMENLRKRTEREVDDARRYAVTTFARDLLEVSDNLARAVASIPGEVREAEGWAANLATGVDMTERTLLTVFEKHKISRIAPEKGEKFDHQRHQAMFEVPTDAHPPGTVAEVMAVGYLIADRLLRPAMVGVAKAAQPAPTAPGVDQDA